jgi:AcrR family transcriptional regulator
MAGDTKARLITAAERLFAAHGVDAVSLREIGREAGARNVIAVQYHFADRDGVVRAIVDKHMPAVDADRLALLDELGPELSVRDLAGALVRPLAAKLADESGRDFLQIHADLLNRPRPQFDLAGGGRFPGLERWRSEIVPLIDVEVVRLHGRFSAIVHTAVELGRRARSGPRVDDRLFTSHLVDQVTALLTGPLSEETRRLVTERNRAGRRSA